jgi:hypothetical protein
MHFAAARYTGRTGFVSDEAFSSLKETLTESRVQQVSGPVLAKIPPPQSE